MVTKEVAKPIEIDVVTTRPMKVPHVSSGPSVVTTSTPFVSRGRLSPGDGIGTDANLTTVLGKHGSGRLFNRMKRKTGAKEGN